MHRFRQSAHRWLSVRASCSLGVFGLAVALIAGALPARAGWPAQAGNSPRAQVGFWTGQSTKQCRNADPTTCPHDLSAYTPAVWDALQKGHGALYFDLMYTVDFGPGASRSDALPLIRKANALGVTVKAWFTAPLAHGTFANEDNAGFEDAAVKSFYQWRNANHLGINEVVFDMEFPAGYQAAVDATKRAKLAKNRGPINPMHQCDAIHQYAKTISWAHQHGLVLSGSPMPFLLDDLDNHDIALADEIDAAPLIPGAYDHLYLQSYRTYSDTGPDYPAQYQRRMHHYFGKAGEISLGDTTMGPPYQKVDALVADVRAAVALGATAIPIFELASSVQKYGPAGIRRVLDAGGDPMSPSGVAAASRTRPMTTANLAFFATLNRSATAASPHANDYPTGCPVQGDPLHR
jgi:hypothetical protein